MPERTAEDLPRQRAIARPLRHALMAIGAAWLTALTISAPAHAAYDALAAQSTLTTVGGPFTTGANASAFTYSPDGKMVATTDPAGNTVRIGAVAPDGSFRGPGLAYATGNDPVAVAFSPDQRLLTVANKADNTVSVFWLTTDTRGSPMLTLAGAPQPVGAGPMSLAFSPNGRYLATANSGERRAMLYQVSDSGQLTQLTAPLLFPYESGTVQTVRFSSRGVLAVGVSFPEDSFFLYQVGPTGSVTTTGEIHDPNAELCDPQFSPDGRKFAYSDCYYQYDTVKIKTITDDGHPGADVVWLPFFPAPPSALAWSPDGSLLATANIRGDSGGWGQTPGNIPVNTVTLFSVTDTGAQRVGHAVATGASPTALHFDPSGGLLTALSPTGLSTYRLADHGGDLVPIGAPTANPGGSIGQVAFNPDSSLLATTTDIFGIGTDGMLTHLGDSATWTADSSAVAFGASGHFMARVAGGRVSLSSVSASGVVTPIGSPRTVTSPSPYGSQAVKLAFDPSGTLLAVTDATGVWTFKASDPAGLVVAGHETWANALPEDVAFGPGGRLAVADADVGLVTFAVAPATGALSGETVIELRGVLLGAPLTIDRVAFSADGTRLAALSIYAGRLWLIDASDIGSRRGVVATPVNLPNMQDVAFSPADGSTLVVGTSSGPAVYDTSSGLRQLAAPSGGDGATGLAVSADGKFIAGAGLNVWSLAAPWLKLRGGSGPSGLQQTDTAAVSFSADYPTRFECRLDGAAYAPCTSPWTVSGIDDGAHTADVRARDLSGTVQDAPVSWTWKSDVHGPHSPELSSPQANATNLPPTGQKFVWKATTDAVSDVEHYELLIDGTKAAELTAGECETTCAATARPALDQGAHTWSVRVFDTLGNATTTATRGFTVDATPPTVPALAGPDDTSFVGDGHPVLSWTASRDDGAGIAGYDVLLDGAPVATQLASTATSWTPPAALGEGAHTWQVVATDGVGNRSGSTRRSFTVDETSPTAALRVSPSRFVPPFEVTADAGDSTDAGGGSVVRYEFDLDGDGTYETTSTSPRVRTTLTTLGVHALGVRVVDRVGRTATAATTAVGEAVTSQDTHEASVSINAGAEFTRSREVSLTIKPPPLSGAVTMIVSNDGAPDQTLRRPVAARVDRWSLAKGDGLRDRRIVYVTFYNSAGLQVNNGRVSDDILYDPYAPTVKDVQLRRTGAHAASLTFHANDRGSGLAQWQLTSGRKIVAHRTRFAGVQRLTLPKHLGRLRLVLRDKADNATRVAVRLRR